MEDIVVIRNDGIKGKVVAEVTRESLLIEFDDGSQMVIPQELLIPQEDGTYYLVVDTTEAIAPVNTPESALSSEVDNTETLLPAETAELEDELVIPVVQEELTVETERVARQVVRVHKRVETREEIINTSLNREQVVLERIPINELIEGTAPKARKENGVLIIPVIEEVLVVEKRLLLREEVRVSKRRTQETIPQKILLHREVVEIERTEPDGTELI